MKLCPLSLVACLIGWSCSPNEVHFDGPAAAQTPSTSALPEPPAAKTPDALPTGVPLPAATSAANLPAEDAVTGPVVIELFSSEGCSSCPPADVLLQKIDAAQPTVGAQVIALEFHVDYWNNLGWADPFSSASYTKRQQDYGKAMGKRGIYTPQMVADGQEEFVGSDGKSAKRAIAAALARPHVRVLATRSGAKELTIKVSAAEGASGVYVAQTERNLSTKVERGENAGRTLAHGPVVRSFERVGVTQSGQSFSATLMVPEAGPSKALVVLVADEKTQAIRGAAELRN
jgi:hypothetical protein